jgi:exosome complex exonuclease RRP6
MKFKAKPDNVEGRPWRPPLTEKPHAMVPLDFTPILDENGEETFQYCLLSSLADTRLTQNPYQYEITHSNYPAHVFDIDTPPMPPVPLESQELIWVDDMTSFRSMLEELKKAREIAVDLEHHDYRSYYGFVCLMQISTREKDWIVDTLELREELSALNEIFANPNIVKVNRTPPYSRR